MMIENGDESYFEACRRVFRGRPETYRIELYIEHADRERGSAQHFYRLANACLDGGSVPLWRTGVAIALTRSHDSATSVHHRCDALRRLGDWAAWQDAEWPTKREDLPPNVDRWWDGVEDLAGKRWC
jgi:hypothetical protein